MRNRGFPFPVPMPILAFAIACLATALAIELATPAAAAAGVWKCRGSTTVPVYQDKPCTPAEVLRDFTADPPPLSVVPFAPAGEAVPPRAVERRGAPAPTRARRAEAPTPRGEANERRFVREGMTEGEVLARLGQPDLASGKGARKARWTFLPASGDPQTMTLVRFEDGRVVRVERLVVR